MSKMKAVRGKTKAQDKILADFEFEDDSQEVTTKKYQEIREDTELDEALEDVDEIEIPIEEKVFEQEKHERQLNMDAIKNMSSNNKSNDDGIELLGDEDEYDDGSSEITKSAEEQGFDLFSNDEEEGEGSDETDMFADNKDIAQVIEMETNQVAQNHQESVDGLDLFDEDEDTMTNESLGGSELYNQPEEEEDEIEVTSFTGEKTFTEDEENNDDDIIPTEDNDEVKDEPDDPAISVYGLVEESLKSANDALHRINTKKLLKGQLDKEYAESRLSEEEIDDIQGNLDLEQLNKVEAKVYDIPDDIENIYKCKAREKQNISVNHANIEDMLATVEKAVEPVAFVLTKRRYIRQSLLKELKNTGKHYYRTDEIYPIALPDNVEIIKKDGKTYYAFINIPTEYFGYRTVFQSFLNDVKRGIQEDLISKGIFEVSLLDENNINILTVAEFQAIIKFIEKIDMFYRIENNKLIISC